jgi:hypothetical protein
MDRIDTEADGLKRENPKNAFRDALRSMPLPSRAKSVGRALHDWMKRDGRVFRPEAKLVRDTGLSIRTVRRAIADLVAAGLLKPTVRHAPGRANEYRACVPTPVTMTREHRPTVPGTPVTMTPQGVKSIQDEHRVEKRVALATSRRSAAAILQVFEEEFTRGSRSLPAWSEYAAELATMGQQPEQVRLVIWELENTGLPFTASALIRHWGLLSGRLKTEERNEEKLLLGLDDWLTAARSPDPFGGIRSFTTCGCVEPPCTCSKEKVAALVASSSRTLTSGRIGR